MITQAYLSRCSSWKPSSKAGIACDFSTLLRIKQGEKRKRCHWQADFRWLWQAADFSTRNPINKPAMNNRRILMEAVFHCVRWVEKTVENIRRWHKNLSASAISKQVSICCINFPHELTCQISTNQSIKIGRRAWLMHDFG